MDNTRQRLNELYVLDKKLQETDAYLHELRMKIHDKIWNIVEKNGRLKDLNKL